MNLAGAVVIYVLWWWIAFMAVLPRGVESRWESEEDGVKGADPGAPVNPEIKKKAILASIIAAGLWAISAALILSGLFNFRE